MIFYSHIAVGLAAKPLVPPFASVLLLPLGNWVDRYRSLRTEVAQAGAEKLNVLS